MLPQLLPVPPPHSPPPPPPTKLLEEERLELASLEECLKELLERAHTEAPSLRAAKGVAAAAAALAAVAQASSSSGTNAACGIDWGSLAAVAASVASATASCVAGAPVYSLAQAGFGVSGRRPAKTAGELAGEVAVMIRDITLCLEGPPPCKVRGGARGVCVCGRGGGHVVCGRCKMMGGAHVVCVGGRGGAHGVWGGAR